MKGLPLKHTLNKVVGIGAPAFGGSQAKRGDERGRTRASASRRAEPRGGREEVRGKIEIYQRGAVKQP